MKLQVRGAKNQGLRYSHLAIQGLHITVVSELHMDSPVHCHRPNSAIISSRHFDQKVDGFFI